MEGYLLELFKEIEHGDQEHRDWLYDKMVEFSKKHTAKNKIIHVSGEDYASVFFEDWVRNNKLTFEEACKLNEIEDDEGYAEIEVREFGDICPKFLNFVYSIQDYDSSKNENFYLRNNDIFNH